MARLFTDAFARRWSVSVTPETAARVHNATGVQLEHVLRPDVTARLFTDYILMVDVLWAICQTEALAAGVDNEDFNSGILAAVFPEALRAVQWAVVDVMPVEHREDGYAIADMLHDACWRAFDYQREVNAPAMQEAFQQLRAAIREAHPTPPAS